MSLELTRNDSYTVMKLLLKAPFLALLGLVSLAGLVGAAPDTAASPADVARRSPSLTDSLASLHANLDLALKLGLDLGHGDLLGLGDPTKQGTDAPKGYKGDYTDGSDYGHQKEDVYRRRSSDEGSLLDIVANLNARIEAALKLKAKVDLDAGIGVDVGRRHLERKRRSLQD